jgi:multidrug resistance efflux pump
MDLLLILIYVSICYVIFKVFRIAVNQWTLGTAVLGGILGISLLLLVMNYNHPFSTNARIYFATTPILPGVKGRVSEVPVQTNAVLKEGDVLFRLDPKPYEYAVQQKRAALAEAEQFVGQLKASLDQASAGSEKAKAQLHLAKNNYDRQAELFGKGVVAKAALENVTRNFETSQQMLAEAVAAEERARLAHVSMIGGVNTTVARVRAELDDAEYDLAHTVVRAPSEGFVTQMALRPGMYVVPAPLRPVMVFVNTGAQNRTFAAAFQQATLQRVMAGDEAEIAFDAVPGRVFKGKVQRVIDAIASGELQASGSLVDVGARKSTGDRAIAVIDIMEDISTYQIPLGSAAEVAIYTHHFHHVSVMRRILLRMRSWLNYVYSEGH